MQTYENLLLEEQRSMWDNMVFVVTKVSFTDDYKDFEAWIDVMKVYKRNLAEKICES